MVINRNSGLYKFASWFKSTGTQFDMKHEDEYISVCRLFWFTVHSTLVTTVLSVIALTFVLMAGLYIGLPILSVTIPATPIWGVAPVTLALVLFMGLALWAVFVALVSLVAATIANAIMWISERKFSVPDSIQERMTVFSIVPEFIKAKKAKFCPTIKIE